MNRKKGARELRLNVNNLSRDPRVDALGGFFWRLHDDARDRSLDVVRDQSTGVDAQTAVDVLQAEKESQIVAFALYFVRLTLM